MLEFSQSDTAAALILTLNEKATTPAPAYYFLFTHVTTRQTVTFTKESEEDESLYPERYNKFTINPLVVFAGKAVGEWHYKVYENDASGVLMEQGKLIVNRATEFAYEQYNSENSFKTYNG